MTDTLFELNGGRYQRPIKPLVVVCIDGGDPAYLEASLEAGVIPNTARFMKDGFYTVVDGTVPSFTCPNNMSIITGSQPEVHGISGNFYLDPATREPVVMTGPELLRSRTVLAEYARCGLKIVSITSKDKLRQQLQKGLDLSQGHVSFSAQYADRCTLAENGIENVLDYVGMPQPDMYSPELSLFVLEAGIRLLQDRRPDVLYLSLTDFVQHKYAPREAEALDFYARLDDAFGRLAELGAVVGLTADHGMNDKAKEDGSPNVIFLQDVLDQTLGKGQTKVICPITDPFVAHHGSLGGFVRVYCNQGADAEAVIRIARSLSGVESVWDRDSAARVFQLPADREGDVVVVSEAGTCIGAAEAEHDLEGLKGHRLRTHGGVSEARVPFIVSEPLNDAYWIRAAGGRLRSHHIFEFTANGTVR
ncbi:MAG: phosphonoacetate hydrolase [Gammaproteobacteria bacterium]|nr:phosphonoacetate hydrolase [Gammaproteobacteria bacterium]MDH3412078.1 phosphonoacetate hydrolase [Gammaproteobacteria bacterium]